MFVCACHSFCEISAQVVICFLFNKSYLDYCHGQVCTGEQKLKPSAGKTLAVLVVKANHLKRFVLPALDKIIHSLANCIMSLEILLDTALLMERQGTNEKKKHFAPITFLFLNSAVSGYADPFYCNLELTILQCVSCSAVLKERL